MKLFQNLLIPLVLIFVSFLSVADFALRPGHPITFDGHIHMTTMNQYAQAFADGEFPIRWSNNFANFGHPLPLIAHQVPAYLGGLLVFAGISTELSFLLLVTLAVTVTSFLYFYFFKQLTTVQVALTATIFATFFPYRVINIYTRGALPELLAMIWLPVLLFSIQFIFKKKTQIKGLALLAVGILLTALTHPMMLLLYALPVGAYFLFLLFTESKLKQRKELILKTAISIGLGVAAAGYYLFPLFIELRYFHQVKLEPSFTNEMFLSLKQLYDPSWHYTFTHPGPRGNYLKFGILEFGVLLFAISTAIYFIQRKKLLVFEKTFLFWTGLAVFSTLVLLPISEPFYHLPIIEMIQYPWRFLSILQFVIPLLLVLLLKRFPSFQKSRYLLGFIILILFLRVPQFYGKNYVYQPESDYEFTKANLHSTNLNTVWSSDTDDYPTKTQQAEIIEGTGILSSLEEKNASRIYETESESELRILENTFYFPGWIVLIDGEETEIQYQDPNYRGLITFVVPDGNHTIEVFYTQTITRTVADLISIFGSLGIIAYIYLLKNKPAILKFLK